MRQKIVNYFTGIPDRLMKLKLGALLAFFAGLLVLAYFLVVQVVPWVGLKVISTGQERALGEQFYKGIISNESIDSVKTKIVREFAGAMVLSKTYPIQVTVVKDKTVNAFALPGGHIVIYSGIIDAMRTPEELAALLGHEASHVNQRHSLRNMLRTAASGLLVSVLVGDVGGVSAVLLENANTLRNLSYSRGLEKEADHEGMLLLLQNQINPVGMQQLMESLEREHKDLPGIVSFISTHPLTKDRIKQAAAFIKEHAAASSPIPPAFKDNWEKLKAIDHKQK